MNIWVIKLEEPILTDNSYRPYRMDMLAESLLTRGHTVTRWCSNRITSNGELRSVDDVLFSPKKNHWIQIISTGVKYHNPLSPKRLIENFILAFRLKSIINTIPKPDLIVCGYPTPEIASVITTYAVLNKIPMILDIRDLWPDIFYKEFRSLKLFIMFPLLYLMRRNLRHAARNASSIVGITLHYRDFGLLHASRGNSLERDRVFPHGFDSQINQLDPKDDPQYRSFWENILGSTEEKKIIYFAGRFNSTVLNALGGLTPILPKIADQMPNYIFVLCGSGQYFLEIKDKLNKFENVICPGEIDAKTLSWLRNRSYIAIQPIENRFDFQGSLSNKFFEFLSSGLPIVSCLQGVTRQILESEQVGFYYSNEHQLFLILEKLYVDPILRKNYSENCSRLFCNEFDAQIVYREFAKHCEAVAKRA